MRIDRTSEKEDQIEKDADKGSSGIDYKGFVEPVALASASHQVYANGYHTEEKQQHQEQQHILHHVCVPGVLQSYMEGLVHIRFEAGLSY
jgi:hypothetical protein